MQLQNCLKYVLRGKRSTNPIRKKVHCVSAHTYDFQTLKKSFGGESDRFTTVTQCITRKLQKVQKYICGFFQSLSSLISVESYFIFKAIYFCTILTIIQRTVHPKGVCVGGESNLQTKPICLLIINLKWTTRFFYWQNRLVLLHFLLQQPKIWDFFYESPPNRGT